MTRTLVLLLLASALCTPITSAADPQGGGYAITEQTLDNGGGVSIGGDYALNGTIGQPDAAARTAEANGYQLAGGFWSRTGNTSEPIELFADGFETISPP